MRTTAIFVAMAAVASLLLSGCATPQAALDQARHGVSLIGQLELSLAEFRRVEQNAEEARRQSLAEQVQALEEVKSPAARDARARVSAGDTATVALLGRLIGDADGLAADTAAAQAARQTNETVLATLITPLPSTLASTTAAQKKLAEMGSELPNSTRAKEFLDWAKTIRATVDANKKKIDDAEAAAKK